MAIRLTPEMMEAAYRFLLAFKPIARLNLPDADEIEFFVTRSHDRDGHVKEGATSDHRVCISAHCIGHASTLLAVMAHEMFHVHQAASGVPTVHTGDFHRYGRAVCRLLGYDERQF